MRRALLTGTICLALGLLALTALPGGARAQNGQNLDLPDPITDADYRNGGLIDEQLVELGRLLFFDPVLSGNENISCATCHHPDFATADGLSLPLGEGGRGLGLARTTGSGASRVKARVPRNAPALFNLGAVEFERLFHDGRVAEDASEPSGFASPAGDDLPPGLDSVLAAQAMFPVTSNLEMAGDRNENVIGRVASRGRLAGNNGVWARLARRLQAIPDYVERFATAFDDVTAAGDVTFVHAANAIAAYEESAWRSDESPFDAFLRGDEDALTAPQMRGMNLFYGRAGCDRCHAGPFLTDQTFRSVAMPQIGPGTGDGDSGLEDFGRERVTGDRDDRYRFRTPSLRNVELTGPWGHDGAYASLEAIVRHYANTDRAVRDYDTAQAILPSRPNLDRFDFLVMGDPDRVEAIAASSQVRNTRMNGQDVADLVAFLVALTDPRMRDLSADIPASVPSGLDIQ